MAELLGNTVVINFQQIVRNAAKRHLAIYFYLELHSYIMNIDMPLMYLVMSSIISRFCILGTTRVEIFWIISCHGWNSMQTIWRPWLKRERQTT